MKAIPIARHATAVALAVVAGGFAGVGASTVFRGSSRATPLTRSESHSHRIVTQFAASQPPTYPTNQAGQTYGSAASAATAAQLPDLISVVGANGVGGYVEKSELEAASGGDVASPAQAVAWDNGGATVPHTIPVFAVNGTTQLGTFTVAPAASAVAGASGASGTSGAGAASSESSTG